MNLRWKLSAVKRKAIRTLCLHLEHQANSRWFNFPFGREPIASRDQYEKLALETYKKQHPEVDIFEIDMGFTVDMDWLRDLALHTQIVIKKSELCYQHGRVLYAALSKYIHDQPPPHPQDRITIWETGTARGFSAICMAKALVDQNRPGLIMTFDVLPHQTPMYWNCIDDHDGPKTRSELLHPWKTLVEQYVIFHQGDTRLHLPKVQTERIHFAFLDGAHNYESVWFEFEQIKDRQQPGDIVVYDDYTELQFPGIVRAVNEICSSQHYHPTIINAHNRRSYVVATKQ
jgi:hypothetical protein